MGYASSSGAEKFKIVADTSLGGPDNSHGGLSSRISLIPVIEGATRRGAYLPIIFIVAIASISLLPRIALHDTLWLVHFAVVGVLLAWYLGLYWRDREKSDALNFRMRLSAPHYVQACLHFSIYVYWGLYWELVSHNGLLLISQILFAFAFEALLNWSRGKEWRLGFGPFPIIFSTNLFLTFKDDWFIYQFVLIAVGFLAKEFIVWKRDGIRTHIFNPSAFALFLFAIVLISTGQSDKTWVSQLSATLDTRLIDPESHPYLFLFALGLIAQFLFQVTLVTLASATMLFVLVSSYGAITGTFWFVDTGIPIAVFLGLHLLITDPATSPRNAYGRFLFGAIYGTGVFVLYGLLDYFGEPLAYDKLLFVPLLNLLVIPLDRAGMFLGKMFNLLREKFHLLENTAFVQWNLIHMAIWIGLFSWMYIGEFIESDHPGRQISHWEDSCVQDRPNSCSNLAETLKSRCTQGALNRCSELSDLYERKPDLATSLDKLIWYGVACDVGAKPECDLYKRNLTKDINNELLESCRSGDSAMSCYVIGSSYFKGINRGSRDRDKAYDYIIRGCELGLGQSCAVAGIMYQFGVSVEKDLGEAVGFHKKACARSFTPSCVTLSELYATPTLSISDEALGNWYRAKACAIGASPLCAAQGLGRRSG